MNWKIIISKELSKRICKVCGIEPKIGICDRELNPDDYYGECGFFEPRGFECNDCTNFHPDLISYPDFRNPENFVKLINITQASIHILTSDCDSVSGLQGCSDKYIKYAAFNKYFKKSMREAEWIYD